MRYYGSFSTASVDNALSGELLERLLYFDDSSSENITNVITTLSRGV
jgi:hypothetical protein